ncbi:gliding motility-associated C-terminal domain-containing protein [Hymenobacter bucti]|uniref:Gliding motility-associated C-terminal domain-containing protein n=1 Tax=Hymenobacter bucti TaxID=1844114 RepID=A0ABW4QUU2_9BACT
MLAELPHPALSTRAPALLFAKPGWPASASDLGAARSGRLAIHWLLALLLLLLSGAATTALGQATTPPECSQDEKFANTWYFGYRAGLDFNQATDSIPPTVLTDGRMTAPAGAGVMSDGTGKILFYSNGDTIWNGNHTVMTNGTGMGGSRLVTDGPLPIRMPGSPPVGMPGALTRYLIFTQDAAGGPRGLSWSEIIIPAGGGPGTVTLATKNTPLTQGTTEKMTGVFHKNGCDIWIIVHGWGNAKSGTANRGDSFLAYRVTTAGVNPTPIISTVGSLHAPSVSPLGYRGQMKVTPDGQRLAVARYSEVVGDSSSTVELFSFDTSTGQVSANPQRPFIVDSGEGKYYGVDFSAGSKLYATVMNPPKLLQFDISGNGPVNKQSIPLRQTTPVNLGSLQAAPDGKIYVARENQPALGFITYPDSVGAKARYADDSLTLRLSGRSSGLGLVNFNQSSLLRVGFSYQSTSCLGITFTAPPIDFDNKVYAWDFGDGATSTLENPQHTYAAPGNYVVTVRITTNCFCRESQGQILVPGAPTPGSIGPAQALCAGGTPAPLASTAAAGAGTGQFSYQWQSSADNATWADISGATAPGYAPGALTATTYFRRLVTSGFCAPRTPTASVAITVLPALAAGSIAADQTVCAGTAAAPLSSSTPAAGGSGTFAYQWEASADNSTWAAIGGATGENLSPGVLTATTYFRRRVTSGPCAALSNTVTIAVTPALAAGSIAADQVLCANNTPSPLTSSAAATGGTSAIAYQWEFSLDNSAWAAINGATGLTYAPGALSVTTYFRRRASSSTTCAPVFSNVVTITVAPVLTAGGIAADQGLCTGSTPSPLTSTAEAGGTSGITYQWESSLDNATWTAIGGATGPTFAPGALTATTYYRRRATSSTACAPVVSNVVTITVAPALTAGSIAADQLFCAGATPSPLTSTSAAAGGTGTIAYQWESSADNSAWTALAGATGPTYAPGQLSATTYFRRRATSGPCGPVFSNVVTITVAPALTAGTIGADQTLCLGATPNALNRAASPSGGTGSYAYQWESSVDNATWAAIAGATGPDYAPGPLTVTTYFRRRLTSGPCGPVYSPVVTLTVLPTLNAGTIAANQTICAGATPGALSSILGAAGGTGTFAYQWESSTDNASWTAIAGATNATFAPGALTATTYFRRRVASGTGTCSMGISNVVTILVQPVVTPTVSLTAPPVQCPGTALTFTAVAANAGAAPTFSWFVNNVAVASGPTFTSSTLATGDLVRVEVTPTAGLCSTGAAVATVTVTRTPTTTPTLTIAAQPNAPVCPGEPLTFSIASVTGAGAAPSYQWQINGNDVAGATTPVFTSTTLRDGQTVTLRLRTTNECGQLTTAVSNGVVVRIQPPVVVNAGPDKEILAGTSVTLEGTADGTYPVTWSPALGLTIPPSNPLRPIAAPLVTTTYTLSAGTGGCASSDQVTVTVRPAIRIPNAFTPNGDGRDDTWQIEFIEQYPDNTVNVFNRWGNKIFSATNYSRANEWRGDINGQPAPVGTYYYVVVTKGPLGKSYAGSITILY